MKIHSLFLFFCLFLLLNPNRNMYAESQENIFIKIDLWSNELLVIEKKEVIKRYPIAPGTDLSPTPIGIFEVNYKAKSWGGGFGTRWLGLNVPWGMYGIHGTNKPRFIGQNVSSSCIRNAE